MKEKSGHNEDLLQSLPPEALATLHPAVKDLLVTLIKRISELEIENRALKDEVRVLKSRLGENSSNSSKPPSSDPPWIQPKQQKPPSGRPKGGQKGHPGHHRELMPQNNDIRTEHHYPETCEHCGTSLKDNPLDLLMEALRHQVIDIPLLAATIVDHLLHSVKCPTCRKVTRAKLPEDVTWSPFGPGLQATVALLTGRYRLSRREAEGFLQDILGIKLSLGSVCAIEQTVSAAIEAPVEEIQATAAKAPVVNVDETGWQEGKRRAWLWSAVTPELAIFHINYKRGKDAALQLLGSDFQGIVGSDRWKAYRCIPIERRGICHAHLKRDFEKMVSLGGASKSIGEWGLAEEVRMFDLWERFKNGEITRQTLAEEFVPLKARMKRLLTRGQRCGDKKTEGMCKDILWHWKALWTFVSVEGVEPTNNAAERVLRKGVLWRKGSFGTQSESGSRFVERILTVAETCRRQGVKLMDFIVDAVKARTAGKPAPSLVPVPTG